MSADTLWFGEHRIGRFHSKGDGITGAQMNIEDPSVQELLSRHFNPAAPYDLGAHVEVVSDVASEPIVSGTITARRRTEYADTSEGFDYEVLPVGDPIDQLERAAWYLHRHIRKPITPTGWVDPDSEVATTLPTIPPKADLQSIVTISKPTSFLSGKNS